jgi:hypothetical protein
LIEDHCADILVPKEVNKTTDKLNVVKDIVSSLLEKNRPASNLNDSNAITCSDCQNY